MASTDPTPEEILAAAGAVGGRISHLRREVLRMLSVSMPAIVDAANASIAEPTSIRAPRSYVIGGQILEENAYPALIVGTSISNRPSPPRVRFRDVTLQIYIVDRPQNGREQLDDLWDLAELVDMTMLHIIAGWCVPEDAGTPFDGQRILNSCEFESMTQLPEGWDEYSGVVLSYRVDMSGINGWS